MVSFFGHSFVFPQVFDPWLLRLLGFCGFSWILLDDCVAINLRFLSLCRRCLLFLTFEFVSLASKALVVDYLSAFLVFVASLPGRVVNSSDYKQDGTNWNHIQLTSTYKLGCLRAHLFVMRMTSVRWAGPAANFDCGLLRLPTTSTTLTPPPTQHQQQQQRPCTLGGLFSYSYLVVGRWVDVLVGKWGGWFMD